MLPSSTRLTIFQRGIAQKCIVFCTYIISITVTALILDWLDKKTFLNIVHEVNAQGSISEQAVNAFTILIESREGMFFLKLIFIGTFCGVIGLLIIRQAAKLQSLPRPSLEQSTPVPKFRKNFCENSKLSRNSSPLFGTRFIHPKKPKTTLPLIWKAGRWKKFVLPWVSMFKHVQDATGKAGFPLKSLSSVKYFLRHITQLGIF